MGRLSGVVAVVCAVLAVGTGTALGAFADDEPRNFAKTNERYQHLTGTRPSRRSCVRRASRTPCQPSCHPRRHPSATRSRSLCFSHHDGCAGDVRFYDWDKTRPATSAAAGAVDGAQRRHDLRPRVGGGRRAGAQARRGDHQRLGAGARAAVLAPGRGAGRAGYVVLTWDPQTQGRSDSSGRSRPPRTRTRRPSRSGRSPRAPRTRSTSSCPRPAARSGRATARTNPAVNHAAKQNRRVAEGRNAAFNPLHAMLDPARLGIAGQLARAPSAVSEVASKDPRVDAVVAWDQLRTTEPAAPTRRRRPSARVPGLGMSGDYGIGSPNGAAGRARRSRATSAPDPQGANGAVARLQQGRRAHRQVNTRAGTHFESAVIPNPGFPATLRGIDQYRLVHDRLVRQVPERSPRRRPPAADQPLAEATPRRAGSTPPATPTCSRRTCARASTSRDDGSAGAVRGPARRLRPAGRRPLRPLLRARLRLRPQTLRRVRPARCATAVRLPRRLDLSRSSGGCRSAARWPSAHA